MARCSSERVPARALAAARPDDRGPSAPAATPDAPPAGPTRRLRPGSGRRSRTPAGCSCSGCPNVSGYVLDAEGRARARRARARARRARRACCRRATGPPSPASASSWSRRSPRSCRRARCSSLVGLVHRGHRPALRRRGRRRVGPRAAAVGRGRRGCSARSCSRRRSPTRSWRWLQMSSSFSGGLFDRVDGRAPGLLGNPVHATAFLVGAFALAVERAREAVATSTRATRAGYIAACALFASGVQLSGGRTGLVLLGARGPPGAGARPAGGRRRVVAAVGRARRGRRVGRRSRRTPAPPPASPAATSRPSAAGSTAGRRRCLRSRTDRCSGSAPGSTAGRRRRTTPWPRRAPSAPTRSTRTGTTSSSSTR